MENRDPNKLTLEKLEIHKRLLMIEEYITEGKEQRHQINETMNTLNLRAKNLELMIYGDNTSIDKLTRDGMNRRVETLEQKDKNVDKVKGNFLKIAVGAITLAVGSFVLWLFQLIWKSVGK